ncbi:MAG: IS200/IS605 family transposase [Spirochaetes bacterium]|nr:IS200/IS605 family transposase [Spirochaetota bacterium]
MSHTYSTLIYHLVFVVKYRSPLITPEILERLRALFGKKSAELDSFIHIVNGHRDHVHVLISSSPKASVSHLAKHLKGYSSFMMKDLRWQNGYAAFTVDERSFQRVFGYIKNQEKHHAAPWPRV